MLILNDDNDMMKRMDGDEEEEKGKGEDIYNKYINTYYNSNVLSPVIIINNNEQYLNSYFRKHSGKMADFSPDLRKWDLKYVYNVNEGVSLAINYKHFISYLR